MHSSEEIITLLNDSSTLNRRKAAKIIFKEKTSDVGQILLDALVKELKNENSKQWETQVEMIKAIGKIRFTPALPVITDICRKNKDHDAITIVSAAAYVRLKRESLSDISPVLELLALNGFSVSTGALTALGIDQMMPDENGIKQLISICFDLGKGVHPGLGDPRSGLIAACANWNKSLTNDFLLHCVNTGNGSYAQGLAQQVLDGKSVTLAE